LLLLLYAAQGASLPSVLAFDVLKQQHQKRIKMQTEAREVKDHRAF
jgi:hypothetical protein